MVRAAIKPSRSPQEPSASVTSPSKTPCRKVETGATDIRVEVAPSGVGALFMSMEEPRSR